MVTPNWEQFQQPADFAEKQQIPTDEENPTLKEEVENKPQPTWNSFKSTETYQGPVDPTADESAFGYITRNLTANASRLVESSLGKYGDIEQAAKGFLTQNPWIAGPIGMAVSEWAGPDGWNRLVNGNGQQLAPTSRELQRASEELSGGYTKAKTPGEEKFQEFTKDVGTLGSARTGRVPTPRQAGLAGLANLGKRSVEGLGFGEDQANYAKMGIWTALSLLDKVNAPRYAAEMSNRARAAFNPNLQANVPRYGASLQRHANNPSLLVSDPRTNIARGQINQLQQNIANGQNSIESLLTAYDGTNAAKRSSAMFELPMASDKRFATNAVNGVLGVIRNEIQQVSAQQPGAFQQWTNSVASWRVIHESQRMNNWVQDLFKGTHAKLATSIAAPLFGAAAYGASQNPAIALTAAGAGFAANKLYEVSYRMLNDPNLREYYINALSAAAREDAPVFIKNFEKLNKAAEKDKSIRPLLKPIDEAKSK